MGGPFWESWGGLEAKQASMKLAIVALSAACVLLGVGLIAAVRRPPTVVVLPEAERMREVRGEDLAEGHFKDFGRALIYTFGSWTYLTVEEAYGEVAKRLSPKILAEFQFKTKQKVEEARRSQMSESFLPAREKIQEGKDGKTVVRIEGRRMVYVGKSVVNDQAYFYELTIGRRARDLANPLGIEVVGIKQGELAG